MKSSRIHVPRSGQTMAFDGKATCVKWVLTFIAVISRAELWAARETERLLAEPLLGHSDLATDVAGRHHAGHLLQHRRARGDGRKNRPPPSRQMPTRVRNQIRRRSIADGDW